ncbi:hypothetical protein RIF29_11839 [Crotalaria pallida]|uniref:FAF domain-containing protein n=1 Tax=Crotalaria pallida TaxID=3830 RepID=A0AAN9P1K3_CROPI
MVYVATSGYSTILLWCLRRFKVKNGSNTKANPQPQPRKKGNHFGFKALTIDPIQNFSSRFVHSYTLSQTTDPSVSKPPRRLSTLWATFPPSIPDTVRDGLIGTESGDCMLSEIDDYIFLPQYVRLEPEIATMRRNPKKIGFPPPINLLRGKENWVMKRECREDGRVVMTLVHQEKEDDVNMEFNEETQESECDDREEEETVGCNVPRAS